MYNVLICDDQVDIVNALKIYLTPEGYNLFEAFTGREAVDLDALIAEKAGMPIPEIFATQGEAAFRALEREVTAEAGKQSGKIILTGGVAYGPESVEAISKHVSWIAPITVYPGEDELLALTQGALRVLNGEEELMEY